MSFEENIKKWVSLDNQLKTINEKVKKLRDEKNSTEDFIMNYVEEKEIKNATINISDGKLRFATTKQTSPLTLKLLLNDTSPLTNNRWLKLASPAIIN